MNRFCLTAVVLLSVPGAAFAQAPAEAGNRNCKTGGHNCEAGGHTGESGGDSGSCAGTCESNRGCACTSTRENCGHISTGACPRSHSDSSGDTSAGRSDTGSRVDAAERGNGGGGC